MPYTTTKRSKYECEIQKFFSHLSKLYNSDKIIMLGLGLETTEMLQIAGVNTVRDLAESDPDQLLKRLQSIEEIRNLVRRLPDLVTVGRWVEKAKESNPENVWQIMVNDFTSRKVRIEKGKIEKSFQITLTSTFYNESYLTVEYLEQEVVPYIKALANVQEILEDAVGGNFRVLIFGITRNSPITVSIDGISDALRLIQEVVTPWRRDHAERMAKLAEQEKLLLTERIKAEVLKQRASAQKDRAEAEKIIIDSRMQEEYVEKIRLDNERARLQLEIEKIQLAATILAQFSGDLTDDARQVYVSRLLRPVDTILRSDLEISRN